MSSGYTFDDSSETESDSGEITWNSREENFKQEIVTRERRIQTAYKLLWQGVDGLLTNLRIIDQPPCQLDIQLIEKRLVSAQKQLEIIKQQHNQLLRVKQAGSYIESLKQQVSVNDSPYHRLAQILIEFSRSAEQQANDCII